MEKLKKKLEAYIGEDILNPSRTPIAIDKIGQNEHYTLNEKIHPLINSYIKRYTSAFSTHFELYTGITYDQRISASMEMREKIITKIEELFSKVEFPYDCFHHYFKTNVRLSTNRVKTLLKGENPAMYEWISKEEADVLFAHYKGIILLQFEKILSLPNEKREEKLLQHVLAIFSCSYANHSYAHYVSESFLSDLFGEQKLELMKEISTKWYQSQPEKFITNYPISLNNFSLFEQRLFLFTQEEIKTYQQAFYALLEEEYENLPQYGFKEIEKAVEIYDCLKSLPNWI